MNEGDLSGTWRAAPADDRLRREFAGTDFVDEAWEPIQVPGHWRSNPAFADSDGPLFYRRTFDREPAADGQRSWLLLDGVFYQGDVWLDGTYLGDTEGYFFRHTFEVTHALEKAREHSLAVEVTCTPQLDRASKRNITGVFQHWDCLDRDWNPGGLWKPVRIEETGPVRIRRLGVICRDADTVRAVLEVHAFLDAVQPGQAEVCITVEGAAELRDEVTLAAGENQLEWTVTVDAPRLWWPRALGDQPLHEVEVDVLVGGTSSHRLARRVGLRTVRMKDWILEVNGERMFVKGSNAAPTRQALGEATPEELAADVALALDTGLDLLRVHAHISRTELYEAADEAGLLIWQDLPFQWGYAAGIRRQAVRQARKAVEQLGHHPSVVIWCAHNEPMAIDVDANELADPRAMRRMALRALAGQELPTWNRTILDRSLKRALQKSDGSRPVIPHSGIWPHLPTLDGTDGHFYFGWYHGDERDFPEFCRRLPRMVRFVTEFGAQAVPEDATFCEPESWPDLAWQGLGRHHCLQKPFFDRHVPPADYDTFEAWREATQHYQARVIKHHVETLRRLKYEPTGGFCQFMFADALPAVTWSVLGHDRQPKIGHAALAAACQPVIVVADRPPATVSPGDRLDLDVHAVSDLRHPVRGARVTARLSSAGGDQEWSWEGDLPADSCVRIGAVETTVPPVPGDLDLDLELTAGDIHATNRYTTTII